VTSIQAGAGRFGGRICPAYGRKPATMTIVAHAHPFVIGVDTHARTHTLAVLVAATGELVATEQFPATGAGMDRAVAWAARRTDGELATLWVIEGVATYGAHLASAAKRAGYEVVEAAAMNARAHRGTGKSDPVDARRIAASVLSLEPEQLRRPRSDDGIRAALRILVTAREHMTTERTATVNALTALLRVATLGVDARKPLTASQIGEVARWRTRVEDLVTVTARAEAIRLAKRVVDLNEQLATNHTHMIDLIHASKAAVLLDKTGIGPVTVAVVYTAWSHVGRVRSEAAFAALAGVNPIPASSGNTVRHRLNRGGDRRLNRALHMAVITRMTHDPDTKAYVERRRAEGRTTKEIRRCLKRYLARHLYRTLERLHADPTPTLRPLDKT
jgi:transposase